MTSRHPRLEELSPEEQVERLRRMLENQRERCRRYKRNRYENDEAYREHQKEKSLARYRKLHGSEEKDLTWRATLRELFNEVSHLFSVQAHQYVEERFLGTKNPTPASIQQATKVFTDLRTAPPQFPPGMKIRQCILKDLLRQA